MADSITFLLEETEKAMNKTMEHTHSELARIRTGKADPAILDKILVKCYDTFIPISQIASISVPDSRLIVIKPWEKNLISNLEKAIQTSDLEITPQNDGEIIRLVIPPLTEERRKILVRKTKQEIERGKIQIRNIRKNTNECLRKLLKEEKLSKDDIKIAEKETQSLTNVYIRKVDELFLRKEKNIMSF